MTDAVLQWLGDLMSSPWIYVALFLVSLIDAMLPIIPSEAPMILAGVYAASTGHPNFWLIVAVSIAGAFIGDHCNYFIGRRWGTRLLTRLARNDKRAETIEKIRDLLFRRGASALIIARFIPWGRIAATLLMGALRFPLRKFSEFDLIACILWALYGTIIGYVGGHAFEENPVYGLALGLGLALVIAFAAEKLRPVYRRWRGLPEEVDTHHHFEESDLLDFRALAAEEVKRQSDLGRP